MFLLSIHAELRIFKFLQNVNCWLYNTRVPADLWNLDLLHYLNFNTIGKLKILETYGLKFFTGVTYYLAAMEVFAKEKMCFGYWRDMILPSYIKY